MRHHSKINTIGIKSFLFIPIFLLNLLSCGSEVSTELVDGINDEDHRVFVTSTTYNGNLGGLIGADTICKNIADSSGLERNYKAILSDSSSSAASRLQLNGAVYAFSATSSAELISNSGNNLWKAPLLSRIKWDESYQVVNTNVWTGSTDDGGINIDHCSSWNSSSSGVDGWYGRTSTKTSEWIESNSSGCNDNFALYCISVNN